MRDVMRSVDKPRPKTKVNSVACKISIDRRIKIARTQISLNSNCITSFNVDYNAIIGENLHKGL